VGNTGALYTFGVIDAQLHYHQIYETRLGLQRSDVTARIRLCRLVYGGRPKNPASPASRSILCIILPHGRSDIHGTRNFRSIVYSAATKMAQNYSINHLGGHDISGNHTCEQRIRAHIIFRSGIVDP